MRHKFFVCCLLFLVQLNSAFSSTLHDGSNQNNVEYIIKNIIPDGHAYLAVESRDLESEIQLMSMSQEQLEKTTDYQLFKSNGDFRKGIDPLLFMQAELYCKYHGLNEVVSANIQAKQEDEFEFGKYYSIEWPDEVIPLNKLQRKKWSKRISSNQGIFEEKKSKFCPHLFFTRLECGGWF